MRVVENDDASSLIDPSAEDLASQGLAEQAQPPPYGALTWNPVTTAENAAAAAAALTESEMSEKGETTSVFHHLQTDSGNTDCDLLLEMAGETTMSPPRSGINFSDEGLLFPMPNLLVNTAGGIMMSPPRPRMNFSGEEALFLTPDFHTDMGGGMMLSTSPPRMNYFSTPSGDSHFLGGSFEPYRFWDDGAYSVGHELHNKERKVKIIATWNAVDSELFSHNEFWFNNFARAMKNGLPLVADTDDNLFWKCKCITFNLVDVELGIRGARIEQKSVTHPPSGLCGVHSSAVLEFLENQFGDTSNSVQPIIAHFDLTSPEPQHQNSLKRQLLDNLKRLAGKLAKSHHTDTILPAVHEAECRMMELNSPCEGHISKSSATNEETNNVVELNNSIHAKGGNNGSEKTDTISRWEKDHGITHQVLQQLFGKSRDSAAKTLKVSTSTLKRACRDFGINRWPNHKGKMPYCTLNQKQHVQVTVKKHKGIQPACPALPPLQPTMPVKVTYKNDTIRFPLSSSASTIKYLEVQLETKFKISLENFSIKYQDEEDEWITLTCDSELLYGLDVLRSSGKTVIRMMITPKFD